ncbi:hypothetical protein DPMN_027852 [Dreissena polymorpha]|uniref:Uncharacterized protein n=1 Tax=Dreissena polymorpha TaxID=45954 RepID=A0A9D4RE10_DREPO|nr:hypothetical protein DPMN_027852 [Dreissena polymorpha]
MGTPATTQTTTMGTPATTHTTTLGTPAITQTTMVKLLNHSTPNTQTTELLRPATKHIVIPMHLSTHPASTQGMSTITHSTQPSDETSVMPSSLSTTRRVTTPPNPGQYSLPRGSNPVRSVHGTAGGTQPVPPKYTRAMDAQPGQS